jgi:ketosteroid isomerase-like protein
MVKRGIVWLVILLAPVMAFASDEPDHAIHEELRGLLRGIEQAINTEHYDQLGQYFTEQPSITTINQEVISSRAGIVPYFKKWFGPGGYLKQLHMVLTPDQLTALNADKTFGIVRGGGEEDYILADGRKFDMRTRWTATVVKDTDGKWRIRALHIGTNFLDNPLLAKAEASLTTFGIGGLVIGGVIGLLVGVWMGRRRKPMA